MEDYLREKGRGSLETTNPTPALSHRSPVRRKTTSQAVKHLSIPKIGES